MNESKEGQEETVLDHGQVPEVLSIESGGEKDGEIRDYEVETNLFQELSEGDQTRF